MIRSLTGLILLVYFGCRAPMDPGACMDQVIAHDDSLGRVRNHACERISLAETIRQYTEGLSRMPVEGCPKPFVQAFGRHRQAWLDLLPVVADYPALRGEMHDLFVQLESSADSARFNTLVAQVWATWGEIEAAIQAYSPTPENSDL